MAYCVVKENIYDRTCLNHRMNKVFIAVKYKVFILYSFLLRANFPSRDGLYDSRHSLVHLEKIAALADENKDCVLCFTIFC